MMIIQLFGVDEHNLSPSSLMNPSAIILLNSGINN